MDTKRYGMLEYSLPLIRGMDNQAEYLTAALAHCKPWLAQEVRLRHYQVLGGFLSTCYEVWKHLAGPDNRQTRAAKHAATEILRRAERAMVLVVREGQEASEIGKQGELGGWAGRPGSNRHLMTIREATGLSQSYLQELRPLGALGDDQFEAAIEAAKMAGRLSRTNILRMADGQVRHEPGWVPPAADRSPEAAAARLQRIREMAADGMDSRQMEGVLGTQAGTIRQRAREMGVEIPAENVTARSKHLDYDRIVTEALGTLEGVAMSLDLVSVWEMDRDTLREQRLALGKAARRVLARVKDMRLVEESDREYANSSSA